MKHNYDFDTLSQAVNYLTEQGYEESFTAEGDFIQGAVSKNKYRPDQVQIVESYRFEGETNPQDSTILFSIQAKDGLKGTLVMSYSAKHSQDTETIKKIPRA